MFIEGENSVNAMIVYQGKTGAIGKAEPFVIKTSKEGLCRANQVFRNSEDSDMAAVYLVHKLYSSLVAAPHFKKGVGFVKNVIRSIKDRPFSFKLFMNRFCFNVVLVLGDSKGTEGSGIHKDLHGYLSPYKYLS